MIDLYAPPTYRFLSIEVKRTICNGCGAKDSGWLIPDTLWGLSVEAACNIHDYMCYIGLTEDHREGADRTFLNNMLRIIAAKPSRIPGLNWLRRRRAYTYYKAVRLFGGPAYWNDKNEEVNIYTLVT